MKSFLFVLSFMTIAAPILGIAATSKDVFNKLKEKTGFYEGTNSSGELCRLYIKADEAGGKFWYSDIEMYDVQSSQYFERAGAFTVLELEANGNKLVSADISNGIQMTMKMLVGNDLSSSTVKVNFSGDRATYHYNPGFFGSKLDYECKGIKKVNIESFEEIQKKMMFFEADDNFWNTIL